MKRKLKPGEKCPLHGSTVCACHESRPPMKIYLVVRRVQDFTHPRGYRELCSPAELRRRKHALLAKDQTCWLCGKTFTDYNEIDLEHKEPKGMGGARRDDHRDNLALAHRECNLEKGSRRVSAG